MIICTEVSGSLLRSSKQLIQLGDYRTFASCIESLIHQLFACQLKIYILFDGALPDNKIEKRLERDLDGISRATYLFAHSSRLKADKDHILLPPLTFEVCLQLLRRLAARFPDRLKVEICTHEADAPVALCTRELNAVSLSLDSDYYIYDLGKGFYMPLDSFAVSSQDGEVSITGSLFASGSLARSLGLPLSCLPLVSALAGNDYVPVHTFRPWLLETSTTAFRGNQGWQIRAAAEVLKPLELLSIDHVISYISQQRSNSEELAHLLRISVQAYDLTDPFATAASLVAFSDSLINIKFHDIALNHRFFCSVLLEDITRESAYSASRSIRAWTYSFIRLSLPNNEFHVITETIRRAQHMSEEAVELIPAETARAALDFCQNTSADGIDFLKHEFAPALQVDVDLIDRSMQHVCLFLHIHLLCCCHYASTSLPHRHELVSLIIAIVASETPKESYSEVDISPRAAHLLIQFQATIHSLVLFMQAMGLSMPNITLPDLPSILPNGSVYHYCVERLRGGAGISSTLEALDASDYARMVAQIEVTAIRGIEAAIVDVIDIDRQSAPVKGKKLKQKKSVNIQPVPSKPKSQNMFDLLSNGSDFG